MKEVQGTPIALVLAALLASGAEAVAQGAPPVQVAAPLSQTIKLWDEYTGRFEAREQVEVRARVSGFIEKIHFRDGQMVNKGDLLFTIDQRSFRFTADAAQAEVERAKAQVALAENEVERAEGLTRNQTITMRDLDQRKANLAGARASLQGAEANFKQASLNLEWTEVRAPIAGRISDRRVDAGNLIVGGQGATLLTNIISVDPINFVFEASEADYIRYVRLVQSGTRPSGRENPLPVRVRLADESEWKREGQMEFVDNQLNARSGTIRGRAIFDNRDQFLTPGTFGRLQLYGGEINALLVPDSVIVSDQTVKVVLTVGPDNKIVPKPVTLGPIVDGLRVVRAGLAPEDKVVVNGLANPMVRPGAVVQPQPGEIKPPARP
ncbi:MAG: efflux transporter periplasmic adaptor subunit [Methylobacterium sp.]|nr:MAG: efflux transporter periplasmic adaptor subunit [Methylobacterium sp.]